MRINIKPLSVNEAWKGRRFMTDKYKKYLFDMSQILPRDIVPEGKLTLNIRWGLSSKTADVDNPVKCFVDCLQKKYGFNDKQIYRLNVEKVDVTKGKEFIEWSFESYKEEGAVVCQ